MKNSSSSIKRREGMLREMGLAPLWKLRQPLVADEPVVASSLDTASATRPPVVSSSGEDVVPASVEVIAASSSLSAVVAPVGNNERANAIAAMDWRQLQASVAECTACALCRERKQAVLGVGDESAGWLFVGEAPGAEEDERGEPFVGQAGQLLDAMLAAIGLERGNDVYIANAVKCRPPDNHSPTAEEMAACRPYLERQVALLKPRLIVALGRPATQTLLQEEIKISAVRGQLLKFRDTPLVVTYHPAYLLRKPSDKAKAWEDLCLARRTMTTLK